MKRFSLEFDFTPTESLLPNEFRLVGGCWDYTRMSHCEDHISYGEGSTMKTMKGYISRIKKQYPSQNPHNFRIFDREAPEEPCGHIGQIYFQV